MKTIGILCLTFMLVSSVPTSKDIKKQLLHDIANEAKMTIQTKLFDLHVEDVPHETCNDSFFCIVEKVLNETKHKANWRLPRLLNQYNNLSKHETCKYKNGNQMWLSALLDRVIACAKHLYSKPHKTHS